MHYFDRFCPVLALELASSACLSEDLAEEGGSEGTWGGPVPGVACRGTAEEVTRNITIEIQMFINSVANVDNKNKNLRSVLSSLRYRDV